MIIEEINIGASVLTRDQLTSWCPYDKSMMPLQMVLLSPSNTMYLLLRDRRSFSMHFSSIDAKPSLCSFPMLVITVMSGLMMLSNTGISSGCEIPASMIARPVLSSMSQTDSGTPICEL